MQTQLSEHLKNTALGKMANNLLRSCVHCGFCNATCPTYQLLGDELDGPRGRIYLIKQILEGKTPTQKTKQHLDRCLNCLNCETTCPSGVKYHHLLEIGQELIATKVSLVWYKKILRSLLLSIMPYPQRFDFLMNIGQRTKFLLPHHMANLLPHHPAKQIPVSSTKHATKVLLLSGCVHRSMSPTIHPQTSKILNKLNIQVVQETKPNCCGALPHHLQAKKQTLSMITKNIDAWIKSLEQGVEYILSNASGCGSTIKDYPHIIQKAWGKTSLYYQKALIIAKKTKDLSELITLVDSSLVKQNLKIKPQYKKIAYHPPCTLQHGQKLPQIVEKLLTSLGVTLQPLQDQHLCCGSAGTYSIFNPKIANQLRANKLENLLSHRPDIIATANIGCLHHLQVKSSVPVIHWIELFE